MLYRIQSPKSSAISQTVYFGDDWQTQGDWLGRYGSSYNVLCAAASPFNQQISFSTSYGVTGMIGPHHADGDALRLWGTWPVTDNPKSLYTPVCGFRRQAEWDDHGETYPPSYDGPDVWVKLSLPEGRYRIGLYFFNKDGHDGSNRYRDYTIELKRFTPNLGDADIASPLAHARVRNFWGGVYKSFLVVGGTQYYIKVSKNNSLNAILSAVLIDKVSGPVTPDDGLPMAFMGGNYYSPPIASNADKNADLSAANNTPVVARAIWDATDNKNSLQNADAFYTVYRLLAYRSVKSISADHSDALLANWRWQLHLWTSEDRRDFVQAMIDGWHSERDPNPRLTHLHKLGCFLDIKGKTAPTSHLEEYERHQ